MATGNLENPLVMELIEIYLQDQEQLASKGLLEPRTLDDRAEALGVFEDFSTPKEGRIGDRRVLGLAARDLHLFQEFLESRGLGEHIVIRYLASVRACWSWAADTIYERQPEVILNEDAFAKFRMPPMPVAQERYFPDQDGMELLKFIIDWGDAAPPNHATGQLTKLTALCFRFIYQTGCRPSEAIKAEWTDVYPELRSIVYARDRRNRRRWRHKTGKKTREPRTIAMPQELFDAIMAAKERPGRHPRFIFTHKRGRGCAEREEAGDATAGEPWNVKPLGRAFRALREKAKAAGLETRVRDGLGQIVEENPEVTLYDFRRSFSTDSFYTPGVDPRDAAKSSGHSQKTAEAHYIVKQARVAVSVVDRVAAKREGKLQG
jgi:integrase